MNNKIRRRKLNIRKFTLFIVITLVFTMLISLAVANSAMGNQEKSVKVVVVKYGDNLWKIAKANSPDSNLEKFLSQIYELNGLKVSTLYPGQEIKIPVS
jgi:nucleoid-associated protein YgaU